MTDYADHPLPNCARSRKNDQKQSMPQCVAHRGYKAKYPENSRRAFLEAVKAGATGLETDVHITKDNVVVLSHDASLDRCFGRKERIVDVTWDEIKHVRSIAAPHVPLIRLSDLLDLLLEPDHEHVWILLDVKLDNDPDTIMRLIASTIRSAPPSTKIPWNERVVLGLWSAKHFPLAAKYSPGFPLMHIGVTVPYARQFFKIRRVGFNMAFPMLMAPGGQKFIKECQEKYQRPLLAWTINDVDRMKWCIQQKLDGVLTDDPVKFLSLCEGQNVGQMDVIVQRPLRRKVILFIFWLILSFITTFVSPPTLMRNRMRLTAALRSIRR